jgi:predicted house-cleaning NTP pyrophosphatase (Maf/HAM1 superfamily)
VTILYADPQSKQGTLMTLADSSGRVHFVSTMTGKMSQNSLTIMEELNENDVKLKWFDGEKVLQLVTKAGTHGNFVQIVPVVLIP